MANVAENQRKPRMKDRLLNRLLVRVDPLRTVSALTPNTREYALKGMRRIISVTSENVEEVYRWRFFGTDRFAVRSSSPVVVRAQKEDTKVRVLQGTAIDALYAESPKSRVIASGFAPYVEVNEDASARVSGAGQVIVDAGGRFESYGSVLDSLDLNGTQQKRAFADVGGNITLLRGRNGDVIREEGSNIEWDQTGDSVTVLVRRGRPLLVLPLILR